MHPSKHPAQSLISLLSPTVIELDEVIYHQAEQRVNTSIRGRKTDHESNQWQQYLNLLGQLALSRWLTDHGLASSVLSASEEPGILVQIGAFRCGLIVIENCLSECVTLPIRWIQAPDQAAHFYLILEVAEEEDEVWFRGLIRQDQLTENMTVTAEIATLPLAACEPELTRLLHYCQYLEPSAIPLPQSPAAIAQEPTVQTSSINTMRVQLSGWLNNMVTEGWQAWDSLQPQLAYATRGLSDGVKQGKLVNLGLEVGSQSVALILTVKPDINEKISILIQLLPTGSDRTLPPNIELSLLSRTGELIQAITSRSRDNYIQLKSFRGKIGQQFGIQVKLGDIIASEQFEI